VLISLRGRVDRRTQYLTQSLQEHVRMGGVTASLLVRVEGWAHNTSPTVSVHAKSKSNYRRNISRSLPK
jgi:hypothetical protein